MTRKKKSRASTEFHTVKRLDNTRLVRNVEPVKMRNLYRTVALGSIIAAFLLLYIYQHFKCIDLSFQLEAARTERTGSFGAKFILKTRNRRSQQS